MLGPEPWIDDTLGPRAVRVVAAAMAALSGTPGADTERGFTLLEAAIDESAVGGCNEGQVRSTSALHLVGLTDEPEQSVNAWSYYVSALNPATFHAVAGDYPTGCGSASAGTGWYEALTYTGGTYTSICSVDWADWGSDLADTVAADALPNTFTLSSFAVPVTVRVLVDGMIDRNWWYDSSSGEVIFTAGYEPANGSTVEITCWSP